MQLDPMTLSRWHARGTEAPFLGLDLHCHKLVNNMMADMMLMPQDINWTFIIYATISSSTCWLAHSQERKIGRQQGLILIVACVWEGGTLPGSDICRSWCHTGWSRVDYYTVPILGNKSITLNKNGCLMVIVEICIITCIVRILTWSTLTLLLVFAPGILYKPRTVFFTLSPQCWWYRFVTCFIRSGLHLTQLHGLLNRISFPCKEILRKSIQNVHTEHEVTFADWNVHWHYLVLVWLVYL